MERTIFPAHRWRLILFSAAAVAAAVLMRNVLVTLGMQLLAAALLASAAHPICRQLEKKLPAGVSAALSLLILLMVLALALVLTLPTVARQFGVLTEALPILLETLQSRLN